MRPESLSKIRDVMHTLDFIAQGRAALPESSAQSCWHVLNEVLKFEAVADITQEDAR